MTKPAKIGVISIISILVCFIAYYGVEYIQYAVGMQRAIDNEQNRIRDAVLKWCFTGTITEIDDHKILVSAKAVNTPIFLPKEYIPPFSFTYIPSANDDSIKFHIHYPHEIRKDISIGTPVHKQEHDTYAIVGNHQIDLVQYAQ